MKRSEVISLIAALYAVFFGVWWQFYNEIIFTVGHRHLRIVALSANTVKWSLLVFTALFVAFFIANLLFWLVATARLDLTQAFASVTAAAGALVIYLAVVNLLVKGLEARSVMGAELLLTWIVTVYAFGALPIPSTHGAQVQD